ncbi:hypothetical protein CDD81_1089 [Ophiocordyceps australis]|uniref:F-box domain-containing protein n=1 Tax=Ophiocordyceps australis TaxID=1399860 RepID=A0A2C5Y1Q0_9HYPO|nr:hypothetical protein CDD81_1089 [Ophiocordyceps australis]
MAVIALVASGEERIREVPGRIEAVERRSGPEVYSEYAVGLDGGWSRPMKLPTEIVQLVYSFLSPVDFEAARHCCRAWLVASLDRLVLMEMLGRGGWWSSILGLLSGPSGLGRGSSMREEGVMSKWISRECSMARLAPRGFCEVGMVEFGAMAGRLRGGVGFGTSLYGSYVVVTQGQVAHVYELNHVCARRGWERMEAAERQGFGLGHLRPVTTIVCPRRIVASSMDTSAGRYSIAFLMDGRVGMVCDVASEAARYCKRRSSQSMACVCLERAPSRPPRVERGQRCVYRNICHADDGPRSVAICPQRNCVAFGCAAGIELHWVDALTGQDFSRWFPLSSPSDFLYFLPARRGVDTARRLRLISSAAGVGNPLDELGHVLHGFSTTLLGSGSTAVVSLVNAPALPQEHQHEQQAPVGHFALGQASCAGLVRKVAAGYADHYRAVPLSDGHHILFTDPRSGSLCLGTDAPVGSLTRLLRKVWFLPPDEAVSPVPLLYAAAADWRHGVRVVATFAAHEARSRADWQVVVFYTVPPDVFYHLSRGAAVPSQTCCPRRRPWWLRRRRSNPDHQQPLHDDDDAQGVLQAIEIPGQPMATCSNLTELAVEASPEIIVWAFSADGWARTWALDCGADEAIIKTAVQQDGSVRLVDQDGDVAMAEGHCQDVADASSEHRGDDDDEVQEGDHEALSTVHLQRYDGATATSLAEPSRCQGPCSTRPSHRMSGTASVYLVQELAGIVRLDVELR